MMASVIETVPNWCLHVPFCPAEPKAVGLSLVPSNQDPPATLGSWCKLDKAVLCQGSPGPGTRKAGLTWDLLATQPSKGLFLILPPSPSSVPAPVSCHQYPWSHSAGREIGCRAVLQDCQEHRAGRVEYLAMGLTIQ